LSEKGITHVLSLVGFNPANLKNFKNEPWTEYGQEFQHQLIDIDDVDDADMLIELPKAIQFINNGLSGSAPGGGSPGIFIHCAAGKSRSITAAIAFLLWKYPNKFDPSSGESVRRSRKETAQEAVQAVLDLIRETRPMAEPNDGFMKQLQLWWEMGCPEDVESHPAYQRWAYQREVDESLAVGQAPSRLRFEDEENKPSEESAGPSLRCKKCRRVLATGDFVVSHKPMGSGAAQATACQHLFVEPLSWMRGELEKGELNGRLLCPNTRCGAAVGRYDWKGFKCSCGGWLTPAFSLQRARVDEDAAVPATGRSLGIRMPPGAARGGNL
jgi:dual specificity phosphatase 12